MTWLLNSAFAQNIGITLVHSLWQILIVAAVFAIANRLLIRRSANLRYAVAYGALMLMLALPLATLTMISVDTARESDDSLDTRAGGTSLETPVESAGAPAQPTMLPLELTMVSAGDDALPALEAEVAAPHLVEDNVEIAPTLELDASQERSLGWVLPWLAMAWSLGVIAFSLRPFLALDRCRRIRSQALPIDAPWVANTLTSLCKRIGLNRKVEIASSTLVHVPTVIGFLRPIILLPVSMITGQTPQELSAIVAHELAHIRRHDFVLNLFQTAIETLLFYHPAVWWVSSVVRQERENCCDDIALSICGRKNYATALANLESGRFRQGSLAMVANGGSLYRRIHRIVRPQEVTNPLGRWLAALVAMSALLLAIVAVLPTDSIAGADDQTEVEADKSDGDDSLDAKELDTKENDDPYAVRTYTGKVMDQQGQPVAGVKVYAEHLVWDRNLQQQVLRELQSTLTTANGAYTLTFKPEPGIVQVIATKKGFGPAIANSILLEELLDKGESELDLELSNETPVAGRVVDTEGNPLADVTVAVDAIALPRSERAVADWIANEKPELFRTANRNMVMMSHDARLTATAFPASGSFRHGSAIPVKVKTAADGSFRLGGIGENCRVTLTLSGPNIATRQAIVVAREMKNVVAWVHGFRSRDYTHHGATPTLIASPTQPIVGSIVDADTKKPLSGMSVYLRRFGKDEWVRRADQTKAVTNAEGHFRLLGAPLGGQHVIEVEPALDDPYFQTKRELPVASGSAPLTCNFELPSTKWIRGQVTNEAGDPVVATIEYYPYRDNPNAEPITKFDPRITGSTPDDRFHSDENGNFRIKAIPGRAVLAAVAKDRKERLKYLPNRDEELLKRIGGQGMRKVYNGWSADYFDALVEVDFPEDKAELTQDVVFKLGATRTLKITDDKGRPMSQLQALGRTFPPGLQDESLEKSQLEVIGLQPKESRLVVLLHEKLNLGKVLRVDAAEKNPVDVRLLPYASVTGRVVDTEGVGVENVTIRVSCVQEPRTDTWARELEQSRTDANGRFNAMLPSGGAFRIFAYSDVGPNFSATIRVKSGASYELGDLRHEDDLEEADTAKMIAAEIDTTNSVASAKDDSSKADLAKTTRIHGRVVDANGNGVAAKLYVIDKRMGNVTKPGSEKVLKTFESNADGSFDVSMKLPERNGSVDRGVWNASVLQLVATASGYGPTATDMIDVRDGKSVELNVTKDDMPIEGTIRTLEGEPVVGATIRVAILDSSKHVEERIESLHKQAKREKPGQMMFSSFAIESFLSPGYDLNGNERVVARKLHHSQFTKSAKTDENGRFRSDRRRSRSDCLLLSSRGRASSATGSVSSLAR